MRTQKSETFGRSSPKPRTRTCAPIRQPPSAPRPLPRSSHSGRCPNPTSRTGAAPSKDLKNLAQPQATALRAAPKPNSRRCGNQAQKSPQRRLEGEELRRPLRERRCKSESMEHLSGREPKNLAGGGSEIARGSLQTCSPGGRSDSGHRSL